MSNHRTVLLTKWLATAALCLMFRLVVAQETSPKPSFNGKAVYVGLIEDDRGQLAHLGPKDSDTVKNRTITPAFMRDAVGWKLVQQLNQRVIWTVAFDGKSLGTVESEPILTPKEQLEKVPGPSNTHSILTPADGVPTVGKPEGRFNGNFETIVRRPLVVVSRPNFADPDRWKRAKAADQVVERVRTSFRKAFSHLRQCDASGEPLRTEWNYPNSAITVTKAYGSKTGSFLVETELKQGRCLFNIDGNDLQSLNGNQWFYVSVDNQVSHLGNRWELVDAADYDGDGKSEVIFYVAEGKENFVDTEGYILFYGDFKNSVRCTWNAR